MSKKTAKKTYLKRILTTILGIVLFANISGCAGCADDSYELEIYSWQSNGFSDEFLNFFNINNKLQIKIDITESELNKIQDDFTAYEQIDSKSPIYRMCNLQFVINGSTAYEIEEVGIRMKGNKSRTDFYDPETGINNLIHFKFSFSETFDKKAYYGNDSKIWTGDALREERKNRLFLGMEKLDIKWNRNYDETYIKEYYAYDFFNSAGVLAPKSNIAQTILLLNGIEYNLGIYHAIEAIDATFINRRIKEAEQGGDLYKCTKVSNPKVAKGVPDFSMQSIAEDKIGCEDEDIAYFPVYDLKTNKKTSDNSVLKNFITMLNAEGSNLEEFIDIDYFIKYEAMAYLTGNPDDIRNNYNNFYIYFLKTNGKAIIIPYDYDRVFGINNGWNPRNGMTSADPYTNIISPGTGSDGIQRNPLYTKTIVRGGNEDYILKFRKALLFFAESDYLDANKFSQVFETAKNNYSNNVFPTINAISSLGIAFSNKIQTITDTEQNIDFATYVTLKKNTLFANIDNL